MNPHELLSQVPTQLQTAPWLKLIFDFMQEQTRVIHEQARIIQEQAEQITTLKKSVQELKDEVTRLTNTPKRPKFRPGGGTPKDRSGAPGNGSDSTGSNATHKMMPSKEQQEVLVPAIGVPEGSRFKGYQTYVVQELEIIPKDITYKLEVWQSPDGTVVRASLPPEVQGSHFGYQLRALVHNLYAQGMTEPCIYELLIGSGIEISEGQVHNLLMNEADAYHKQSEKILTAGLEEAPYIRTDDTGEKHKNKSVYSTHIGGQYFAYYTTAASKSRENFLSILLQGKEGYWINEAFIWHLFQSGVEDDWLNRLEEHVGRQFRKKKKLNQFLNSLGIQNKKLRHQCLEAGLVGFISATILKPGQVLLSDRAGQFAVFDHAGCWVHTERPLRKLECATPEVEKELNDVREAIWVLYDQVKEAASTQSGKAEVHEVYDRLIAMKSISPGINAVIASFAEYREELLKALDHPGLPLHNNDSERDIRGVAKRRNISGTTRSQEGREFRDGLLTLKQTCARLGFSFYGYLKSWFKREPVDLADVVREKYRGLALATSN